MVSSLEERTNLVIKRGIKMKELVSVIVPVYNVELYLNKCLNSIVNQTYKNLEIILVDDGSKDTSGKLCDEWAQRDSRISVIHKENGGLVSARKCGIVASHGAYACMVDSDDWLECNMVEELYRIMKRENVDIVTSLFFGAKIVDSENEFKVGRYDCINDGISFYSRMIYIDDNNLTRILSGSVWGKLYKRNLLEQCQLLVDDRITYGEDGACVWNCFLQAESIYISDKFLYHYVIRGDSISGSRDKYYWAKINFFYVYVREMFEKHRYADMLINQLDKYIIEYRYLTNLDKVIPDKNFVRAFSVPYEIIPVASRIVLYGAGSVGKAYYRQLMDSDYCKIEAWVDKNFLKYKNMGVVSVDELRDKDFDYILIATLDEQVKSEMMQDIMSVLKCSCEKILWKKPSRKDLFMVVEY